MNTKTTLNLTDYANCKLHCSKIGMISEHAGCDVYSNHDRCFTTIKKKKNPRTMLPHSSGVRSLLYGIRSLPLPESIIEYAIPEFNILLENFGAAEVRS